MSDTFLDAIRTFRSVIYKSIYSANGFVEARTSGFPGECCLKGVSSQEPDLIETLHCEIERRYFRGAHRMKWINMFSCLPGSHVAGESLDIREG